MITYHVENHTRQEIMELVSTTYWRPHRWVAWTLHGLGDGFMKANDLYNTRIAYKNALNLSSKLSEHESTIRDDSRE